jgi:hypothetical protein
MKFRSQDDSKIAISNLLIRLGLAKADKMRVHHLMCLLAFVGKGYSDVFTNNLREIRPRFFAGLIVELVATEDEICKKCHGSSPCLTAASRKTLDNPESKDNRVLAKLNEILRDEGLIRHDLAIGQKFRMTKEITDCMRRRFLEILPECACRWHNTCASVHAQMTAHRKTLG